MAVLTAFGLSSGCESERSKPTPSPASAEADAADPGPGAPAPMTEDALAERTELWRTRITEDPTLANTARFFEAKTDLMRVSNEAKDVHLRANASLMLGLLYEGRKDVKAAIAQYEHAAKLVPDDAGPYMALALARASNEQFEEAAQAQKTATTLDPDNLENWLVLGELLVKSGDEKAGIAAYVDYERRRKGLIDGLTLKNKGGAYLVDTQERIGCAEALASATDQGTAIALTYALKSDPEPDVQATVASVMGIQRLAVYKPALEGALPKATGEVKEAVAWALSEIDRDPVTPKAPELPPKVVEAAAAAKDPQAPGDAEPASSSTP
ncbi:MAG: hypothetical protein ACE37F_15095 [Nannocystaceae bacterium]|nr:hypothetical protein [bacterium]